MFDNDTLEGISNAYSSKDPNDRRLALEIIVQNGFKDIIISQNNFGMLEDLFLALKKERGYRYMISDDRYDDIQFRSIIETLRQKLAMYLLSNKYYAKEFY